MSPETPKIEKDPNNEKLSKELQIVLKDLVEKYEREDLGTRKIQVKSWKKNDEFWHGVQHIFWNELEQDWKSPAQGSFAGDGLDQANSGPFYDFVMNIYRAHGESIIAALSAQTPTVRFPPDDADNEDDIQTSKTFDRVADLIQRHNKAKMLLLRALFMLWNQGNVCAYHAPKADKKFGTNNTPVYRDALTCNSCGYVASEDTEDKAGSPCPACSQGPMEGMEQQEQGGTLQEGKTISGFEDTPKTRVMIEIFGPLFVKYWFYAKTQKDTPYLICSLDQPKALMQSMYPHASEKIGGEDYSSGKYERKSRTPSSYSNPDEPVDKRDLVTFRRCWLRPWVFDGLGEDKEEEKKKLKKKFPDGVYVGFANDIYLESRNEDVDKYWTIGLSGLSQNIHTDPLGQALIPVQELKNVLVNISIETIEQGIPSTFADPEVLDFNAYNKQEARPGVTYPAQPRAGQNLSNAFFESSRATLSKEVPEFDAQLEKSGQFLVGSFPSIFGGELSGSRTASEYSMSRQMALQRLSISWGFIVDWWASMIEKCVRLFIENMTEDERYTQKVDENYINVWIRRSELTGSVGEVEPEGADTFPTSMAQKQSLLIKIIEMKDQFLMAAVFDPSNRSILADLLGFPEFNIPGEDQRIKQAQEIQMMSKGQPVEVDPTLDDHDIHVSVIKHYMVSQLGSDLKITQPQVYQLLSAHLQAHTQIQTQIAQQKLQQEMLMQHGPPQQQGPPPQ